MKRVAIIILSLILVAITTNCKKNNYGKLDYYISGIYLEIAEDENFVLGTFSVNPSVYYNYQTDTLVTDRGYYGTIDFSNIAKEKKEEKSENIYLVYISMTFPSSMPNKMKLYYIMQGKDGNHFVDKERYEYLDITKTSFSCNKGYNYNDKNYRFQLTLNINRKDI